MEDRPERVTAPSENELRGAAKALGITEWGNAPADAEMVNSVVTEALRLRNPQTDEDIRSYICGLQPGERVVDTSLSSMYKCQGVVYFSEIPGHGPCILWDQEPGEIGRMGTSVTWGARRLTDVAPEMLLREPRLYGEEP